MVVGPPTPKFGKGKDILQCEITIGYCLFLPQGTRKTSSTSVKLQKVCKAACTGLRLGVINGQGQGFSRLLWIRRESGIFTAY